jgi:hypothetical protein
VHRFDAPSSHQQNTSHYHAKHEDDCQWCEISLQGTPLQIKSISRYLS